MTEHEAPFVTQGFVPARVAVRPEVAAVVKVTASVAPNVG